MPPLLFRPVGIYRAPPVCPEEKKPNPDVMEGRGSQHGTFRVINPTSSKYRVRDHLHASQVETGVSGAQERHDLIGRLITCAFAEMLAVRSGPSERRLITEHPGGRALHQTPPGHYLQSSQGSPEGNVISTVLQMSKVKLREVARLAQDFTSVEKQGRPNHSQE